MQTFKPLTLKLPNPSEAKTFPKLDKPEQFSSEKLLLKVLETRHNEHKSPEKCQGTLNDSTLSAMIETKYHHSEQFKQPQNKQDQPKSLSKELPAVTLQILSLQEHATCNNLNLYYFTINY